MEKLPLVLVVANNQYAYSTPNSRQFACRDLLDKAVGYGVTGHRVDATDLADCLEVVGSAIEAAQNWRRPAVGRRRVACVSSATGSMTTPAYVGSHIEVSPSADATA